MLREIQNLKNVSTAISSFISNHKEERPLQCKSLSILWEKVEGREWVGLDLFGLMLKLFFSLSCVEGNFDESNKQHFYQIFLQLNVIQSLITLHQTKVFSQFLPLKEALKKKCKVFNNSENNTTSSLLEISLFVFQRLEEKREEEKEVQFKQETEEQMLEGNLEEMLEEMLESLSTTFLRKTFLLDKLLFQGSEPSNLSAVSNLSISKSANLGTILTGKSKEFSSLCQALSLTSSLSSLLSPQSPSFSFFKKILNNSFHQNKQNFHFGFFLSFFVPKPFRLTMEKKNEQLNLENLSNLLKFLKCSKTQNSF